MSVVSFDGDYSKRQWGLVTNLVEGFPKPLPPANTSLVKPEKIMVQALSSNAGRVIVGPSTNQAGAASTLPVDGKEGGFELAPGEMMVLPSRLIADWVVAGTGDGGQALKTLYLAGPS